MICEICGKEIEKGHLLSVEDGMSVHDIKCIDIAIEQLKKENRELGYDDNDFCVYINRPE